MKDSDEATIPSDNDAMSEFSRGHSDARPQMHRAEDEDEDSGPPSPPAFSSRSSLECDDATLRSIRDGKMSIGVSTLRPGVYVRKRDMCPLTLEAVEGEGVLVVRPKNSPHTAEIERDPDGTYTCMGYRLHEHSTPDLLLWTKPGPDGEQETSSWAYFPSLPAMVGLYTRGRDNGRLVVTAAGRVHLEGKPHVSQPIEFRDDGTVRCVDYTLVVLDSDPSQLLWRKEDGSTSVWTRVTGPAARAPQPNAYPGARQQTFQATTSSTLPPELRRVPLNRPGPTINLPANSHFYNFGRTPEPEDPTRCVAIWRRKDKESAKFWDDVLMQGEDLEAGPELGDVESAIPRSSRQASVTSEPGTGSGSLDTRPGSLAKSRRDTISSLADEEEEEEVKSHPELRVQGAIRGSKCSWYCLFFLVALIMAALLTAAGLVVWWVSEHEYVDDKELAHLKLWHEQRAMIIRHMGVPERNEVPRGERCCVAGCHERGDGLWGIGTENGVHGGPVTNPEGHERAGEPDGSGTTHPRGDCCHYYCTDHILALAQNIRDGTAQGCTGPGSCAGAKPSARGQIEDHVMSQLFSDNHITLDDAGETMTKMDQLEPERLKTRAYKSDNMQASVDYVGAHSRPCAGCGQGITHYKYHACHSVRCPTCQVHTCFVCGGRNQCTCRAQPSGNRYVFHSYCWNWDQNGDDCGCLPCPECSIGNHCDLCHDRNRCEAHIRANPDLHLGN